MTLEKKLIAIAAVLIGIGSALIGFAAIMMIIQS